MIFRAIDITTQHYAITWEAAGPNMLCAGYKSLDHNRLMGMSGAEVAEFRRMVVDGAARREVGRWVLEIRF